MSDLPIGYDTWRTTEPESAGEPADCDECGRPADPESPPLRGKVLCHGCAAYLSFTVLESETEGRIAKLDAVARLRAFADFHETALQPKRPVVSVRDEAFAMMRLQADLANGGK